ncbi:MAG: hypothetical protein U5K33_05585 [Halofilum sp. (in: g-proteobacteria)]|nr:hypothetical protein [Halofilum sp. (in: g-proteobacteria)]
MNVCLTYLYRDAANYKYWGEVTFTNRAGTDPATLEAEIRPYLIDGHWFVADDVGLPDLRPADRDEELDHDWHEVHSFAETEARPSDVYGRDIVEFLRDVREKVRVSVP